MVRGLGISVSAFVGVLLLATIGLPAHAATTTSFAATAVETPSGEPARMWLDEDGILHIRGLPVSGPVSGDLEGTISILANLNLDLATGSGDLFGSLTLETSVGTWDSHFSGTITGGLASGEFVGKSPDGRKIMGTFTERASEPGTVDFEGVILNPKG